MNSKLNIELREKRGLVYHVEATFHPFTDSGLFAIFFGTDLKNLEKCTQIIQQQIKKITEGDFSESVLKTYKSQLLGQMAIGEERNNGVMLSMARSYLDLGKVDSFETIKAQIEGITKDQVVSTANEVLTIDKLSSLAFLPK